MTVILIGTCTHCKGPVVKEVVEIPCNPFELENRGVAHCLDCGRCDNQSNHMQGQFGPWVKL